MLYNDFYLCFSDKSSVRELRRGPRQSHQIQLTETPELDDQSGKDQEEKKDAELERLIMMWRTSKERKSMYEEMEHMEVCVVGTGSSIAP